jgi:hypothetical protein
MFYVVGRIADQVVLEKGLRNEPFSVLLYSNAGANQNRLVFTQDMSNWNLGRQIEISDDNNKEYGIVKEVKGSTLVLESNLVNSYSTSANAKITDDLRNDLANPNRFGGVPNDYFVYVNSDDSIEAKRVMAEDEFVPVWNNGVITGLDFTPEDSYRIMRFEPRDENGNVNDTLTANGVDYVDITASIWVAGLSAIDTTFNESLQIPIINPDKKQAYIKTAFVNGIATKRFKTLEYGVWNIPNKYKFKDQHIKITDEEVLDINALMDL